jgi:hypothetical protein
MTYYPKNKILTNQVATQDMIGEDGQIYNYVLISNNQYYQGYYYALYNGKAYTGKYPGDGDNKEIIKVIDDIDTYDKAPPIPSLTTSNIPPLYPTPKDYEVGVFTRYFSKKRNEYLFDELTKDQHSSVDNTLYIKFQIQWQLVGDSNTTYTTNRNMVLLAEQRNNVAGLQIYLKEDYLKYYK